MKTFILKTMKTFTFILKFVVAPIALATSAVLLAFILHYFVG